MGYADLILYIWGNEKQQEEHKNTLRVHMTHLKRVLGRTYARHIHTVHGEGYVWQG